MLETILGSISAERVLLFLAARGEGYATEIAKIFDTDLSPIQNQLDRMERGGLIRHVKRGRKKIYRLDPDYPLASELHALMTAAMEGLPASQRKELQSATADDMADQGVIDVLSRSRAELKKRYGVKSLALFGSAARGTAGQGSDIDVLVDFDGPATSERYFGVQFYLEDLLGKPVDLVTERALRQELKPYIERDRINV
jgi:predicted nucleotidyltransferase